MKKYKSSDRKNSTSNAVLESQKQIYSPQFHNLFANKTSMISTQDYFSRGTKALILALVFNQLEKKLSKTALRVYTYNWYFTSWIKI